MFNITNTLFTVFISIIYGFDHIYNNNHPLMYHLGIELVQNRDLLNYENMNNINNQLFLNAQKYIIKYDSFDYCKDNVKCISNTLNNREEIYMWAS